MEEIVNHFQLVDKKVFPKNPADVRLMKNVSAENIRMVASYLPGNNMYLIFGKDLPEILKKYIATEEEIREFIYELVAHEVRHKVQCFFQLNLCSPKITEEYPQILKQVIEIRVQSLLGKNITTELEKREFDADVIGKWAKFSRKYEGISMIDLVNILKWGIC